MHDERIENEAMKSAKETLKKKTKNKVTKIIWNAVKAVVIPMLIFALKAMAVVIFIIIAISLFNNILDGISDSANTDEEYNSYIEDSILGGADITAEQWLFTETQVEDFIINYDSDNILLKSQMLNNIRRIQEWQADYGYSAGLLISMAFEENVSDFDLFLEDMNDMAQIWQDNEYTTINQIAQDYVGDETASEWANNITNQMSQTAIKADIIEDGQEDFAIGDGYDSIYISKTGKTYYNYKQNKESSYKNYVWVQGSNNTIAYNGCALVSATIIINGYLGTQKNPQRVVQEIAGNYFTSAPSPARYLTHYGISATRPYAYNTTELTYSQKQEIIDNLTLGRPVIIKVTKAAGSSFPYGDYGEHWMALLDYNEMTDKVYLSNPSYGSSPYGDEGWISKDRVLRGCVEFIQVNE